MIRHLLCLMGLMAGGCAETSDRPVWQYARDQVGHVYPAQCKRDLSDHPAVQSSVVLYVPADKMHPQKGVTPFGLHLNFGTGPSLILIQEGMPAWRTADTLHHERCHAVMLWETGNANWHD